MRRALELAAQETRRTLPNPSVGAVVVKSGEIIAYLKPTAIERLSKFYKEFSSGNKEI